MTAIATNYQVVFNADLTRFAEVLNGRLDELVRHTGLAVAESVTVGNDMSPGTPVDTGFALNSWAVGLNGPPEFHQPPAPPKALKGTTVSVTSPSDAATAMLEARAGDIIWIVSNCVYMEALEFGHSGQAPEGMVRLTHLALPAKIREIAAEMTA